MLFALSELVSASIYINRLAIKKSYTIQKNWQKCWTDIAPLKLQYEKRKENYSVFKDNNAKYLLMPEYIRMKVEEEERLQCTGGHGRGAMH